MPVVRKESKTYNNVVRGFLAVGMRRKGMKYRLIGQFFGLSGSRARQLEQKALRRSRHPRADTHRYFALIWFGEDIADEIDGTPGWR